MPYSMSNVPQWATKKSKAVQRVAIETFNSTLKETNSEEKARIASLAAMKNAEKTFSKETTKKSLITKSLNNALMQATFVVMVPDEIDLHGDITTEEEIRKACHSFNKFCRKSNLFHIKQTESFDVVESWIAPVDLEIEGITIIKGTWICTIQCNEQFLWDEIKSGNICSVSIGAVAKVESIDE